MPKSVEGVMHEFKEGDLHSGKSSGPVVKNRKQAVAIAMSEQGDEPGEKHSGMPPMPMKKKKAKKRKRMSAKEADQKAGSSLKKDLFETYRR